MSREVRKVPANWEHPKVERYGEMQFQPKYDESFDDVFAQWLADFDRIRAGDLTEIERQCYPLGLADWLKDEGRPPDPDYYMPNWSPEERTHFMMYQTTSEGTPISPVFATPEELARWLVDNNATAFVDQTASYEAWLRIAHGGYAPSAIMVSGEMQSGVQALAEST
jgi:hypothetical protein